MISAVWLSLVLAAAPVAFPAPVPTQLPNCSAAACTTLDDVRVCKCGAVAEEANDLLVVDRAPGRRVIWPIAAPLDPKLTDFVVLTVDLDNDSHPELVIANRASESTGAAVRSWQVAIVDGAREAATHFVAQDWGPDAISEKRTLLITEWELKPGKEEKELPKLSFVGREYAYAKGHLEPTTDPVRRRALSLEFDGERTSASKPDRTLTPRQFLAHASTTKAPLDEVSTVRKDAVVRGLTLDEPGLDVHVERADGIIDSLSTMPEDGPPLRLGDAKSKRLFPLAYAPEDAEAWLLGRKVSIAVDGDQATGTVWVTR